MKTMIKALLVTTMLVIAELTVSIAFADSWCHAPLRADDGTEIQIDYQVARWQLAHSPDLLIMANLYTHIKNNAFNGLEDVSVVLMNPPNRSEQAFSQVLSSLSFDGQRFTGKASNLEHGRYAPYIRHDIPGYSSFHLEIAVVVNGRWLRDPIGGDSNFKFYPNQYLNLCANPY